MKRLIILAVLVPFAVLAQAQGKKPLTPAELLDQAAGAKTYKVHALAVRPVDLADGGTKLETVCYRTATLVLKDGGSSSVDLGQGDCALSKPNENAMDKILGDSAQP
jgi:hypothetical protein